MSWSVNLNLTPIGGGSGPLGLPLVDAGSPMLTYLGTFNGPNDGTFSYGGGALSVAGNSLGVLGRLYANGIQNDGSNRLGKMTIPAPTGAGGTYTGSETASTLVAGTTAVPLGLMGGDGSNPTALTGSLEYNGKLYVTGVITYDGAGAQNVFMAVGNTSVSGFGSLCHSASNNNNINRIYSSGLALLPSLWQPILGGPAFVCTGIGRVSVITNAAAGNGLSTFNPAAVISGGAVSLTDWLCQPYFNNTGNPEQVSRLWGRSTATQSNWGGQTGDNYISLYDGPVATCFIPPGSRSLLFVHLHQWGPPGGQGTNPCDPGASGSNATPVAPDTQAYYRIQITAYDLAALVANKNAAGGQDAIFPYAWWEFPNWKAIFGNASSCPVNLDTVGRESTAWGAFDPINNLLYLSGDSRGTNGIFYVFRVNAL